MSGLDALRLLLDDYHEVVYALRTGQTGRANTHLAVVLNRLAPYLANLHGDAVHRAAVILNEMSAARERNDGITLADCLQYRLPSVLPTAQIAVEWLDLTLLRRLREIAGDAAPRDGVASIVQGLRELYRAYPALPGVAPYFAGPLMKDRQYVAARELLEFDAAEGRQTSEGAYLLALARARAGDLAGATALLERLYRDDPRAADGFTRLGMISAERGDWSGALALARRDLDEDRISPPLRLQAAEFHARAGDFAEAERLVERAYAADTGLCNGLTRLAWLKAAAGDTPAALALMARDERQGRLDAQARLQTANLIARHGAETQATALVEEAYRQDDSLRDGLARIGWSKAREGDWRGAVEIMARDAELHRLSPPWQVNLAQLYGRLGEYDRAVAMIESAYRADGGLHDGLVRLGEKLSLAGETRRALEIGQRDLAQRRLSPRGKAALAVLYARNGDAAGAVHLVEEAYEDDPDLQDGFAYLGWVQIEQGAVAEGLAMMRRDIASNRISPVLRANHDGVEADPSWRPPPGGAGPEIAATVRGAAKFRNIDQDDTRSR